MEVTSDEALNELRNASERLWDAYKNNDEHPEDPHGSDEIDYSTEWVHAAYKDFCEATNYVPKPGLPCGGCDDLGSHRRHCRKNPDYSYRRELMDQASNLADVIGANNCGAANACYRAAGLLRQDLRDARQAE